MSDDRADVNGTLPHGRAAEVFAAFFKLGVTSFGGPIAHLGYFRDEFVTRRRWLDEASYADIVALCQFLPGPAAARSASRWACCAAALRAPSAPGSGLPPRPPSP